MHIRHLQKRKSYFLRRSAQRSRTVPLQRAHYTRLQAPQPSTATVRHRTLLCQLGVWVSDSMRGQNKFALQSDRGSLITKGQKPLINERECPHIVEIAIPANGFDHALSREISSFHHSREIQPHFGRSRTRTDQNFCRWCFSEPTTADAFVERFGGTRVTNKSKSV
jgi:hypothetical protein